MTRKAIFVCVLWLAVSAGFLHAQQEKNGAFAGFGIGFGGGGAFIKIPTTGKIMEGKTSQNFIYYDLKAGYKYFLNEWFGLRGYLSFGYSNAKNAIAFNGGVPSALSEQNFNARILEYAANLDLLFNLYATETYHFGLLSGLDMGGTNLCYRDQFLGNANANIFQTSLKVGARLNAHDHGIEFALKIPFFKPSTTIKTDQTSIKMDFKQNYILSMNYVYNF